MTDARRAAEAPHRRVDGPPRIVERAGVLLYRAGAAILGRMPERLARRLVETAFLASYRLWPTKRRWSNENFAHVLGRSPDDPEVDRLSRAAYRTYARYIVELMRLPRLTPEQAAELVDSRTLMPLDAFHADTRGYIMTVAHQGNLEAVARGIARHGWPIHALGDDTAFPELFAYLRSQRAEWGVDLIPWRKMRSIFDVLKRREVLCLVIDWGYKPDGIPVRLFGAWTTLPAGPAVLAARTGAHIVPITVRRDGVRFVVTYEEPFTVDSAEPADLAAATQRIADALERTIAQAPAEWYSFKPLWPATAAEEDALAARADAMAQGGLSMAGEAG
jgi:KDO2-lipid IV(A) lauroyltransferase